jgi:hypothetical protein
MHCRVLVWSAGHVIFQLITGLDLIFLYRSSKVFFCLYQEFLKLLYTLNAIYSQLLHSILSIAFSAHLDKKPNQIRSNKAFTVAWDQTNLKMKLKVWIENRKTFISSSKVQFSQTCKLLPNRLLK